MRIKRRDTPNQPHQAVVVAGGPLDPGDDARIRASRKKNGWLIGVDFGAAHLLALGLVPHVVTGDFDSLDAAEREQLANSGAAIVATPDQNYTDLDKALAHTIGDLGAREILVFAATGGRLDHTISVLSTLLKYGAQADLRLIDSYGETFLVTRSAHLTAETTFSKKPLPGRVLSLIALGPVHGITTTGVRWPLFNETLQPGVRDGTLNEVIGDPVTIQVATPNLIVHLHHDASEAKNV